MTRLELVLSVVVLVLALWIGHRLRRDSLNRRRYRGADRFGRRPLPKIPVAEVDPAFQAGPLGPDPERSTVLMIGGGDGVVVPASTSDFEAWILAVLAKGAHRMFEFGTCSGRTAYLWAANSPPDAKVTTLTLGPRQQALYQAADTDRMEDGDIALQESDFETFLYTGSDVAHKVEQLFGDSKAFDESPYVGQMDLIFIDGSHAYSYVMSDTRKALRLIKPGGIILWHDYEGPLTGRGTDVALLELVQELPLFHIENTRMVGYRVPLRQASPRPSSRRSAVS